MRVRVLQAGVCSLSAGVCSADNSVFSKRRCAFCRQKCVGTVFFWYRVGCILNAAVDFRGGIPLAAMLFYGGGPILAAGLCLLLPETSGKPLPDTVADCHAQQAGPPPLCCPPLVRTPQRCSFCREAILC